MWCLVIRANYWRNDELLCVISKWFGHNKSVISFEIKRSVEYIDRFNGPI